MSDTGGAIVTEQTDNRGVGTQTPMGLGSLYPTLGTVKSVTCWYVPLTSGETLHSA
jgi:hypothetical protein